MNSNASENEVAIETGKASIENKSKEEIKKAKKRKQGKHSKRDKTVAEEKGQLAIIDLPKELLERDDREHLDEGNGGLSSLDLPIELLVKIIEMVPILQWASLELVSHQFQEVVHGLWGQLHEIRLNELVNNKEKKPYQVMDEALRKFFIRAPNVYSISGFDEFFDQLKPMPRETIQLLSKFKHLETIDFSGQETWQGVINASDFAMFLESSLSRQCWKRLDIVGGIYETTELHGTRTFGSKENRPILNLECFKFSTRTTGIFDRFLPPIEWSGLKKLVLIGFSSAKEVLLIIRQCTQLTHLEIMVPDCGIGDGHPSYDIFMQAVVDLEKLSILKIIGTWSRGRAIHDALLVRIQDLGRRGITELALTECFCSDQIIGAVIDHLTCLKSLDLVVKRSSTPLLIRLAKTMDQLVTLKLRSCNFTIDDTAITAILGNMSNLQYLQLE